MNEKRYLRRFIFLETLAVVPGTVAALAKHFQMLRKVPQYKGYGRAALKADPLTTQLPKPQKINESREVEQKEEKKEDQKRLEITRNPADKIYEEMDLFNSLLQ